MDTIQRNRTLIRYILFVIFAIIVYQVSLAISHHGKIAVQVSILPGGSHATANGKGIKSGTTYLSPGSYKVIVKKPGFSDGQQTFPIDASHHYILLALTAVSAAAKQYETDHVQLYQQYEGLFALQSQSKGLDYKKQYPIVGNLPYDDAYYTIGYILGADQSPTITVHTASPRYRYAALQQIRSWGYDPADYRIQFSDYTNPLGT